MKGQKLIYGVLLLASLFILTLHQTSAQTTTVCNPEIYLVNQDPNPAVPNDDVKVLFQVSGLENANCKDLTVRLIPQYPFSLESGYDAVQSIGGSTFAPGVSNVWMIPYKLKIADDALDGDYQIKTESDTGQNAIQDNFSISVTDAQTDFAVVIQDVSGTQASIGIVNTGKNIANSLIVGIPQQEEFVASGINQQIVGNLAAGDYTLVSFNIASRNSRNTTRVGAGPTGAAFNASRESFNVSRDNQLLKVKIDYTDGIGKRRSVIKEVQFNSLLLQGNSTTRTFSQTSRTTSTSSSSVFTYLISKWLYILVIAAIIAAIYFYKKYLKNRDQSNSENAPDWVSSKRAHKKK